MKKLTQYAREHRRNRTPAEKQFRRVLLKAGIRFRTERTIDHYIVDVLIPDRWLVIEIDGGYHLKRQREDVERDRYLCAKGYTVMRFRNETVFSSPGLIVEAILKVPLKQPPDDYRKLYGVAAY